MKLSAISNISFRQDTVPTNEKPKKDKKTMSSQTKALIGAGVVAAGTLAVYFITRNRKAAKVIEENLPKPKIPDTPKPKSAETPIVKEPELISEPKFDEVLEAKTPLKHEFDYGANALKLDDPKAIGDFQKLDDKIKSVAGKLISEYDVTHREIQTLKNGKTKIIYYGEEEGNHIKEILVFSKDNDFQFQQTEVFGLVKTLGKFPFEYKKSTTFKFPDNSTRTSDMEFYLDMTPKKLIKNQEDKSKTLIYGYDFNKNPSGTAYTEDDNVILKLNDKKFGQVFDSFDDLFQNVEKDNFKMK